MPRPRQAAPSVRVDLPEYDREGLRSLLEEWAREAVAEAWAAHTAATGKAVKLTTNPESGTILLEVEKRPPGDLRISEEPNGNPE